MSLGQHLGGDGYFRVAVLVTNRTTVAMTQLMRQDASARVVPAASNLSQMGLVLNENRVGQHRDPVTRERSNEVNLDPASVAVDRRANGSEMRENRVGPFVLVRRCQPAERRRVMDGLLAANGIDDERNTGS